MKDEDKMTMMFGITLFAIFALCWMTNEHIDQRFDQLEESYVIEAVE